MPTPMQTTATQHVHLLTRFAALEQADDADAIVEVLTSLSRELPPHFAHEEAPGSTFDEILRVLPQSAEAIDALREEHVAVIGQIRGWLDRAASGEELSEVLPDAAHALARALRAHETVEGQLIQDAAYFELGVGD